MLGQGRGELDDSNDFDAPQLVRKCDSSEISLRQNTSTKAVEVNAQKLPPVDFTAQLVRIPLWKRLLDVSCVLISVPALLPLILMVAALIKIGRAFV